VQLINPFFYTTPFPWTCWQSLYDHHSLNTYTPLKSYSHSATICLAKPSILLKKSSTLTFHSLFNSSQYRPLSYQLQLNCSSLGHIVEIPCCFSNGYLSNTVFSAVSLFQSLVGSSSSTHPLNYMFCILRCSWALSSHSVLKPPGDLSFPRQKSPKMPMTDLYS